MLLKISSSFLIIIIIIIHIRISSASDSDPLQDYCIPLRPEFPALLHSCKNSSHVTVEDFVFSGLKSPVIDIPKTTKFSSIPVNVNVFPGLNTLGASFIRADFEVGGVNVPHYHPRATEVAFVVEGKIYSGFVDSQNRVFAKVIEKGEVMVFPRGLLHFQMNVGESRATILGGFNSQNPGLVKIPGSVFGSDIDEELVMRAFGLNGKELSKLKKKFLPTTS